MFEKAHKVERIELQEQIVDWYTSSDSRFIQILGGERAGKSLFAALLAALSIDVENNRAEYWVVGPDYLQARPEFMYIYDAFHNAVPCLIKEGSVSMPVGPANSWSFTTIWGATFRTKSASDIQKLASFSVSGVIMAEAAQHIYESYLKLMGRVSETNGFLILSGTLEKGLPWYEDLYKRWQGENVLGARSWSLPTWSNTAKYPGGREDPKIKELEAEYPEDLFMERFGAEPRKTYGLVLPEFDIATHVRRMVANPKLPVELYIDPGQHCYAVLFVQNDGLVTNVLDRVYTRGLMVHDVIPMVMGNPLWKLVVLDRAGVIDNAGKQHQANKSQVELWQEIAGATLRSQYCKIDNTIETLRYRLGTKNPLHEPLVYFNSHISNAKSPDGMALDILAEPELWQWPSRGFNRNTARLPVDRNNDAMKALGYGLIDRYGIARPEKKVTTRGRRRAYWI
jgi:hypothetical protein